MHSSSGSSNSSNSNNNNGTTVEKDEDEKLGSYVGGIWVPYFRHTPEHRYIVADSTRYVLFPTFRGVKPVVVETVDISQASENVVVVATVDAANTGNHNDGNGIAMDTGEEPTETILVDDRKDNDALLLASKNEKEPSVSEEVEVPDSTLNGIEVVNMEDREKKAMDDEMPVEDESNETDTAKDNIEEGTNYLNANDQSGDNA